MMTDTDFAGRSNDSSISSNSNSSIWGMIQQKFINVIQNWDIVRTYPPSYNTRIEGFTEQWGTTAVTTRGSGGQNNNDSKKPGAATTPSATTTDGDDSNKNDWKLEDMASATENTIHTVGGIHVTPPLIRLIQYRPAWIEQLALNVAGIEYVVINSPYAVYEVTGGPLPILQDFIVRLSSSSTSSSSRKLLPAMMGRRSSRSSAFSGNRNYSNNNAILDYIQQEYSINFNQHREKDDELHTLSYLCTNVIEQTLNPGWISLRYNLHKAWEQIYRQQSLSAVASSAGIQLDDHDDIHKNRNSYHWYSFFTKWQTWSERIHYSSNSNSNNNIRTLACTIQQMKHAYDVLEQQLVKVKNQQKEQNQQQKQQCTFLLGTDHVAAADLLLFDHLMNAFTDIYLIIVLADYPQLIQYVQTIYTTYFIHHGTTTTSNNDNDTVWKEWNKYQNSINVFNTFPIPATKGHPKMDEEDIARPAVTSSLMERLTVITDDGCDLQQILVNAKATRLEIGEELFFLEQQQQAAVSQRMQQLKKMPFYTWYRWRMGDSYYPRRQPAGTTQGSKFQGNRQQQQQQQQQQQSTSSSSDDYSTIRREYSRNDEIWLASVATFTLAVILGFGFSGNNSSSK